MRTRILTTICLLFVNVQWGHAQPADEIAIGHKFSLHAEALGEDREYWVSLPASYDQETASHKSYPLLIVLDGQSQFLPVSGMLGFMSKSWGGGRQVPEMIVIGVPSTNRERDFTPDKIVTVRKNDTGGADQFLDFLEKQLIPILKARYRTAPYHVLMGHSLGGLLASHTYLKAETSFNAFIAIDPSFGSWDATRMDQKIEDMTDRSFDRFLYIATANAGNRNLRNRDRHVRFYEALHRKAPADLFRAKLEYFEHENHGSVPLLAFYNGITAMFKGYGLTYRDVKSPEQLTMHYADISSRLSYTFHPPETLVDRVGAGLLRSEDEQQKEAALRMFELNTGNYPNSSSAFDRMGAAYATLGYKEKATKSYQRSVALNPDNEHAKNQLKILTGQ